MSFKIGNIEFDKPLIPAPMEGITDLPFRIICKEQGADLVYTEFIASEALIRDVEKSLKKMTIHPGERPVAVQIFGANPDAMARSAKIAEDAGADILDINYGCWVKKVVNNNAGSALLKSPELMAEITRACAEAVSIPVTIKTRLGWNKSAMNILEIAQMQEQAGAKAIAVHCRTRDQGMGGKADWSWIPRIKEKISVPLFLNGDIVTVEDALRAFDVPGADGIMIGRAIVGNPFIFKKIKQALAGEEPREETLRERIDVCLRHLDLSCEQKGPERGILEFRKNYSGYLRGYYNAGAFRQRLVLSVDRAEIGEILQDYYLYLEREDRLERIPPQEAPKVICRNDV
ncbi:MAG: tRNA dihydrouridine synthase DusB [Chloroflexota bacterium]